MHRYGHRKPLTPELLSLVVLSGVEDDETGEKDILPLTPSFSPGTYDYTVDVGFTTAVEVYATAPDGATVTAQYEDNGTWKNYTLGQGVLSTSGHIRFRIATSVSGEAGKTYTIGIDLGGGIPND